MSKPTAKDLAFQEAFNHYFKPLLFTAYKRLNDWDLAQSIVTCVFAWFRTKRFDFADKRILSVLYIMVRRACREREHVSASSYPVDFPSWMMTWGLVEFTKAIDALSAEQRKTVIHYFNGNEAGS